MEYTERTYHKEVQYMAKRELEVKVRDQLAGLLVAQGVVAVLFGIAALFWPGLTATLFISLFGVFVVVWGLISLVHSLLKMGRSSLWWLELIFSVLVVGLGVFLLRNMEVTLAVVILLVGFTLIVRGIVDFVTGLFSREAEVREARSFYVVGGVLGVVAGAIILAHPVSTGLVFVWALGLYLLLQGALTIGLAFRLRSSDDK